MHYSTITGAAVLLALAPCALATGVATIVNSCGFDIYYASISTSAEGMTMLPPGGAFSEGYTEEGVGVSIKMAPNDSLSGPITQFEFTWAAGKINYDISNINGNPFSSEGMVLSPSMAGDPNNPTCQPVVCAAGETVCTGAYNQPDDTATMVCDQASSLTFNVCSGAAKMLKRTSGQVTYKHNHHRVHARQLPRK